MWILRRGACEKLRGRPCQEQTHVLAEQFSSKENIRVEGKSNIQTKVVTTPVRRGRARPDLRAHPARALPWVRFSSRKLGRPKGLPGASSRLDGKEDRNPALPRTGSSGALTVYFCTNLVGTLRRRGGRRRGRGDGMSEEVVALVERADVAHLAAAPRGELVLPRLIVDAGPAAVGKFLEFFAARIANRRTRAGRCRGVSPWPGSSGGRRPRICRLRPGATRSGRRGSRRICRTEGRSSTRSGSPGTRRRRRRSFYDRTADTISVDEIERIVI